MRRNREWTRMGRECSNHESVATVLLQIPQIPFILSEKKLPVFICAHRFPSVANTNYCTSSTIRALAVSAILMRL